MEDSLLTFPCAFPIKIMGEARDGFTQAIIEIVLRHAPDFDPTKIEIRPSKNGKYLSLTCDVQATSRLQLDALYQELSAHAMVSIVL